MGGCQEPVWRQSCYGKLGSPNTACVGAASKTSLLPGILSRRRYSRAVGTTSKLEEDYFPQ